MTRSSTILIRDVLSTGDRVHKLWNHFTDTPPEYAELTGEMHAFYLAVSDLVSQTARIKLLVELGDGSGAAAGNNYANASNTAHGKQLRAICDSAAIILADVEKFIKKNKPDEHAEKRLGTPGGKAKSSRKWRRFEAASNIYDLPRLKQMLIMNEAAIMDFRSSLTAFAQGQTAPEALRSSPRQDFLAMAIFELMAGAVTVDEDGEGSRVSAQTPAPIDQDKVMAIWAEYGVSESRSREAQDEIAQALHVLSSSGRQSKKAKLDDADVALGRLPSTKARRPSTAKQSVTTTESVPPLPPLPGHGTTSRRPISILLDDRTQSHVGPLFTHHLRHLLSSSIAAASDPFAAAVLSVELCSANAPATALSPHADAKLTTAFLKHAPLVPWRRSLYRPRRPDDVHAFNVILVAGYGGVPAHYQAFASPAQQQQQQPSAFSNGFHDSSRSTAEIIVLEDLAGLSSKKKFSNPLARSLLSMSGKGSWERAEKEVVRGATAFVETKLRR